MRRLLALGSLVVLACAACSGSSTPADDDTQDQAATSPTIGQPTRSPDATPAATTAPKAAPAPASDAGAAEGGSGEGGAGGGTGTGGGDGGGGGGGGGGANSQCIAGSVHEAEGNDSLAAANALPSTSSSFCGRIASASDVDFVAFTLAAGATKLGFADSYSAGGVVFSVFVDGTEYPFSGGAPFKPGSKYTVKVRSTGSVPVDYRLVVSITP